MLLPLFSTRINSNKILHQRFNTAVRKNSYSVRIAKYWNKLPDKIANAPSINAFKNRLDKHWKDEDIYYLDYKSEITGSHVNRNLNDNRNTNESSEEEPIKSCAGNHH